MSNSPIIDTRGPQGDQGDPSTVDVGTTTTGLPGTDAEVVNSGTVNDAIFDFTIPQGEQGPSGVGAPPPGTEDGQTLRWDQTGAVYEPSSNLINDGDGVHVGSVDGLGETGVFIEGSTGQIEQRRLNVSPIHNIQRLGTSWLGDGTLLGDVRFTFNKIDEGITGTLSQIRGIVDQEGMSSTEQGGGLLFRTVAAGTTHLTSRMKIGSDGSVRVHNLAGGGNVSADAEGKLYLGGGGGVGKNLLINGDFSMWQRGASLTSLSQYDYTADRWVNFANADSVTRETIDPPPLAASPYYLRISRESATQSNNIAQPIELPAVGAAGVFKIGASIVTSGWVRAPLGAAVSIGRIRSRISSGNTTGQVTLIGLVNLTGTGDWEYVTYVGTVVAEPAVGHTCAILDVRNNSDNSWTELSEMKVEVGDEATPFEYEHPSDVLMQCRRYFRLSSSNLVEADLAYEMRATPTETTGGVSSYQYDAEL